MKFNYTGWFIQEDISKYSHLSHPIEHPHVTLDFKPENPFQEHFGTKARIRVIGYANDGKNEGWSCIVLPYDSVLVQQAKRIPVQHITISVSDNGKPVDTAKLKFKPLDEYFNLTAVFGGFYRGKIITGKA